MHRPGNDNETEAANDAWSELLADAAPADPVAVPIVRKPPRRANGKQSALWHKRQPLWTRPGYRINPGTGCEYLVKPSQRSGS